jgi:3-dehydroquinate dehydratase / shikimate dehydrogenase
MPMNMPTDKLICVPITETDAHKFLAAIEEAAHVADAVELRLDYLDARNLSDVLAALPQRFADFHKPIIFTFRPREQGGQRDLSLDERLNFWRELPEQIKAALAYADFELDLVGKLGDSTPPVPWNKVICSHHDFNETPAHPGEIYERIARTHAAVVKIATKANRISDCLPLFELMRRGEKPVIILGMGLAGISTRVLALARGATLTFGALRPGAESASGQPTAVDLRDLYRADRLARESEVMGVIGYPIGHSRSPLIHNRALAAINYDAVYLPLEVADLDEFVRDFVRPATRKLDWRLRGLSVTIPHKLGVMKHLDLIAPAAARVGAVNTVVVEGDELHGYNTDVIGAMKPLSELIELHGARAAVIGAGGSARAICYGLSERGARVTVYARDLAKAKLLADEFNTKAASLGDFAGEADVVINCTPIGMKGHDEGTSPLKAESLRGVQLVFDLVYNPLETQLLKDARDASCRTLGGMAMLIEQAAEQFRLWTKREAPVDVMRRAVSGEAV